MCSRDFAILQLLILAISMKLLLYAPEYRPNMSSMIRTAEFYGLQEVFIYDKNGLLATPKTKKERANMQHMGRVWTAGAVDHITITLVDDPRQFVNAHPKRVVGTVLSESAIPLRAATPNADDLLILGPEKAGLPDDILSSIDLGVTIPHRGHTNCLNVAVTCGIVLHHWLDHET